MFDLEKFKNDVLRKFDLDNDSLNYLLLTNIWEEDIELKVDDINYDNLYIMFNSNKIEFEKFGKKAIITMNDNKYFTVVNRDGEAGEDTIYAFYTNRKYFDIDLHIIEFVYDGGIYHTYLNNTGSVKIDYYNPDTAQIFRDNASDKNIYVELEKFSIEPDKYITGQINSRNTSNIVRLINELRVKLEKDEITKELVNNK